MAVVGVGIDLVSIPAFAEQVDQPGTVFAETFTPGERRDAAEARFALALDIRAAAAWFRRNHRFEGPGSSAGRRDGPIGRTL